MRLAYLIIIHKNAEQVKRLFKSVYDPENFYLFHIDAKAPNSLHSSIKEYLQPYLNVEIMTSQNCRWGGYSMVDIELKAIERFLEWNKEWKFFINLSGQDFPLKTQNQIKSFLQNNQDKNFVTVFDEEFIKSWCNPYLLFRPTSTNKNFLNAKSRVERLFIEVPGLSQLIYVPFVKRKFIDGATWYAGWQWMLLNREFCEYLFDECDLEKYTRFFKKTFIPDEGFFQTVIMNSPYRETVINNYKRTVTWIDKGDVIIYKGDKYDFLINSDNLFARKFDTNIDSDIILKLEQRLIEIKLGEVEQNKAFIKESN